MIAENNSLFRLLCLHSKIIYCAIVCHLAMETMITYVYFLIVSLLLSSYLCCFGTIVYSFFVCAFINKNLRRFDSFVQCLWVRSRFGRHQAHPDRWPLCHRRTDAKEHQMDPGQRQPFSTRISRQGTGYFSLGRCASLCRHGGRPWCSRSPEKRRNCRFLEGNIIF